MLNFLSKYKIKKNNNNFEQKKKKNLNDTITPSE